MAEATKVESALTAEEWAEFEETDEVGLPDSGPASGRVLRVIEGGVGASYYQGIYADYAPRKKVAAVALYDQQFGFTHNDVGFLHMVVELAATCAEGNEGYWRHAQDLADRIAALLPPREDG